MSAKERVDPAVLKVADAVGALIEGWGSIDRQLWGARDLYTGEAPKRRGLA